MIYMQCNIRKIGETIKAFNALNVVNGEIYKLELSKSVVEKLMGREEKVDGELQIVLPPFDRLFGIEDVDLVAGNSQTCKIFVREIGSAAKKPAKKNKK